ncbi:MAG TPA: histidine--tRNA ligase [Candidatus Babeliales bacterium]|nr:histidine--tRNA ligase [Candidatus Babeliales bacterium]
MSLSTQPYKGARDFYPEDKRIQKYMFAKLRQVAESFGYQEYNAPLLEPLELYSAKSGEEIVEKQLYSFEDKAGRKLAIRPEMTPSVNRMVAGKRQELAYPLRWYSLPNLWRYERPQAGRLREHWQLNVDLFGVADTSADHEIIVIADRILRSFGAQGDDFVIRINSRKLVDRFLKVYMGLDDSQIYQTSKLIDRWHKIERDEFHAQARDILKNENQYKELLELMESKSLDSLPVEVRDDNAAQELHKLMSMLAASGISSAHFDFSVIRGMDYYNGIVFEVFDTNQENVRSMFGGGRYDGLVELFGVEPVPTVGFGMGDVTLQNFLVTHDLLPHLQPEAHAVAILVGDTYRPAQSILDSLRAKGLNVAVDATGRKLDSQIRHSAKSGVNYAIFIGNEEISTGHLKLRNLVTGEEKSLDIDQLAENLLSTRDNQP